MAYRPSLADVNLSSESEDQGGSLPATSYRPSLSDVQELPEQSYWQSVKNAPGIIGSDIANAARSGWDAIPGYFQKAKTEIPGILNPIGESSLHPLHRAGQALAGVNEAINSIAQFPLAISRYGSDRLHLLPQGVTNVLQKITPENTTQAINQLFGQPQYEGESLLRGAARNLPVIMGATKLGSGINPQSLLTSKNAIKNTILTQHDALETRATNAFKDVSDEVNTRGINQLPTNSINNIDFNILRTYFPDTRPYNKLLTGAQYGDYNSLRKVQSDLYTKGKQNLGSSLEADRMKGAEMLEKRDDINTTIQNHLTNTGNHDLADKLQGARDDWRTLQQTYYNENMNNALVKMVDKNFRKIPKNLINILSEESIPMQTIRNFHPGLEDKLRGYSKGQNILGKSVKYGVPAGAAFLGYEYGKPRG